MLRKRLLARLALVLATVAGAGGAYCYVQLVLPYAELETKLAPLNVLLGAPREGDWLAKHAEPGQTFAEYVLTRPVRRSAERGTIYLCLLGEFSPEREQILELTREYLELYFDAPVKIRRRTKLSEIPERARRKHPEWGDEQVLAPYVTDDFLRPDRPDDALAYVAFTNGDLWPGEGWNYVFGLANLYERVGVWSLYRFGDPAESEAAAKLCLRRTLAIGSHETGHILTLAHCTAGECNMNGRNSLPEADRMPLHLCPTCLRKLCWNLQVEPIAYLARLQKFFERHGFTDEAQWYARAIALLNP